MSAQNSLTRSDLFNELNISDELPPVPEVPCPAGYGADHLGIPAYISSRTFEISGIRPISPADQLFFWAIAGLMNRLNGINASPFLLCKAVGLPLEKTAATIDRLIFAGYLRRKDYGSTLMLNPSLVLHRCLTLSHASLIWGDLSGSVCRENQANLLIEKNLQELGHRRQLDRERLEKLNEAHRAHNFTATMPRF